MSKQPISKTKVSSRGASKKESRWALVSGASSGIGEATAEKLASAGFNVILLARRRARLEKLAQRLKTATLIWPLDLREPAKIEDFIKKHHQVLKQLKVLVNNAGLAAGVDRFHEAKTQDWDLMIDVNIRGLLYLTRSLLPFLLEQREGAHIVNLGSVAGRWVYPAGAVYCATKFAVRALSEGLRMDLQGKNIRVTNIEPGMVETEFSEVRLGDKDKAKAVYSGMRPLEAMDIAESILWCLERPQHVNIQELVIFPSDQAAVGPSYVHRR